MLRWTTRRRSAQDLHGAGLHGHGPVAVGGACQPGDLRDVCMVFQSRTAKQRAARRGQGSDVRDGANTTCAIRHDQRGDDNDGRESRQLRRRQAAEQNERKQRKEEFDTAGRGRASTTEGED